MYTETFDHSVQDKEVEILYPETIVDGCLSIGNLSVEVVNGSERSSDSERQIDLFTRDESGANNSPNTNIDGAKSFSSSDKRSSSSTLSELLSDDFFRIDELNFTTSDASELALKSDKNDVSSSDGSAKSEAANNSPVPTPTYQVYNVAFSQKGTSLTASPPIQMMDRSGRFDSTRIPSSIFERNNNSPLEWSLASNDSLFSIHVGPSFSRDHTFKFGELHTLEQSTKPVELNTLNRIPSITIEEIDIACKSDDLENHEDLEDSFSFKPNLKEDQHDIKSHHKAASNVSTMSSATSLSQESETISHSFVPLKKSLWRFCNCCNWPTCCYTWPGCCKCSCSWLLCSCCISGHSSPMGCCKCSCSWLFCSCCINGHSSPILTETDGISFEKRDTHRQQSYKEELEPTSSSSSSCWHFFQSKKTCNWFHCFSCTCKLSCSKWKCC